LNEKPLENAAVPWNHLQRNDLEKRVGVSTDARSLPDRSRVSCGGNPENPEAIRWR